LRSLKRSIGTASSALAGSVSKSSTNTRTAESGTTTVTDLVRGETCPSAVRIAVETACGSVTLPSVSPGVTASGSKPSAA
jgi:hypothetical protein